MSEQTFVTLREFKTWVNSLSEEELDANTDVADWFIAYVTKNQWGRHYYHIQPHEGGDQ